MTLPRWNTTTRFFQPWTRSRSGSGCKPSRNSSGRSTGRRPAEAGGRRAEHVSSATEDESSSVTGKIPQTAVAQLQEQLNSIGKPLPVKAGAQGRPHRQDEWNVKMLEERLRQQQKRQKEPKVEPEKPQILRDIFQSKWNVMDDVSRQMGRRLKQTAPASHTSMRDCSGWTGS
ncbi:hypothetical protein MTO96_028864 [Rhipicephalus appendiculatus]